MVPSHLKIKKKNANKVFSAKGFTLKKCSFEKLRKVTVNANNKPHEEFW